MCEAEDGPPAAEQWAEPRDKMQRTSMNQKVGQLAGHNKSESLNNSDLGEPSGIYTQALLTHY